MSDSVDWSEMGKRLSNSIEWLLVWTAAIIFNFLILYFSLGKSRQQIHVQKIQFFMGSLSLCNALLSLGLLISSLLVDVFYGVDSFDTLLLLAKPSHPNNSLWQFAKFLIQTELVDNILIVQQFVLLLISIDRYLTMFKRYSSDAKPSSLYAIIATIPFVTAFVPLDVHLLRLLVNDRTVNLIRLLSLLCPLLLSLIFSGCSVVGLFLNWLWFRRLFGPLFVDHLSLSLSLFFFLCVDAIAKFGIFFQLLNSIISIQISINVTDEAKIERMVGIYYSFSHFLLMASPLFHALISLCFVTFYQQRICGIVRRRFIRCPRKLKLNYASETMRSIIADQSRARQMRTGIWGKEEMARGTAKGANDTRKNSETEGRTIGHLSMKNKRKIKLSDRIF